MHGLYVLWWVQQKHVSVPAVATILAAGDLSVTILEIPTGWVADRHGHRVSLIVGSLLQIAGMLLAWLGAGVPGVLASSLAIAAGDAFRSGADQALLFRSCAATAEPAFQAIEARARSFQLAALVAFVLLGGVLVDTWGFSAGWVVETSVSIVGLAIACAMTEPPAQAHPVDSPPCASRLCAPRRSGPQRLAVLMPLVLPAAVLGSVASAATFFVQASGTSHPGRITIFVATVTLAEALGSWIGGRLAPSTRTQVVLAALGTGIAAVALVASAALLPIVVTLCVLMGMSYPLRAAVIQRVAADHQRAQAASAASACDKALATVALVCAGVLPRRRTL